jgi:hypothetical protein
MKARRGGGDNAIVPAAAVGRLASANQRAERVVTRVLAAEGLITTTAAGYVAIGTSIGSSNAVQAAPNWSAFSNAALEYRVVGIEMDIMPINCVNTSTTQFPPCFLATGTWSSGTAPTILADVVEGPNGKVHDGFRRIRACASAKGNPDALLWTAIATAIPAADAYGIVLCGSSTAPAGPISTVVYRTLTRWIVQFRSLI